VREGFSPDTWQLSACRSVDAVAGGKKVARIFYYRRRKNFFLAQRKSSDIALDQTPFMQMPILPDSSLIHISTISSSWRPMLTRWDD
jgi:hypothetical protein